MHNQLRRLHDQGAIMATVPSSQLSVYKHSTKPGLGQVYCRANRAAWATTCMQIVLLLWHTPLCRLQVLSC
jgi:hypothetical protein